MRVNFDANASVRPIPEALECLARYSGDFLNPSSVHQDGQAAKRELDHARNELRELIAVGDNDKIVFTSGATEANNAALIPNSPPSNSKQPDLACSAVEHSAVLECLRKQVEKGYQVLELPTSDIEDIDKLTSKLSDSLRHFALMLGNNETGQIFDIKNITRKIKEIYPRVHIHCDAAQAVGKIKVNFSELGVDTLALSGHKFGAISGVGALIISEHCHIEPWLLGGPQENGLRAGTENILGIKTLGIACREARRRLALNDARMQEAKNTLILFLKELGTPVSINQYGSEQLPNTISIRFPGIKADDLVVALDLCGVAISAGSACASGRPTPSHVLLSHGLTENAARETIRISFEPTISQSDLEFGLAALKDTITRMSNLRRAA